MDFIISTELAKKVASELGLLVDAPRALEDGTMQRFLNYHLKTCEFNFQFTKDTI